MCWLVRILGSTSFHKNRKQAKWQSFQLVDHINIIDQIQTMNDPLKGKLFVEVRQ
jgi:hypothetical protein